MNPLLLTDGYKTGHHQQYPHGTTLVYSNFTPRSNKYAPKGCDMVVSFGQQMVMKQIHEAFQNEFFSKPKDEVCGEMKRELSLYLGTDYDVTHFEQLHDLGYLPIAVKGIEEGTLVPIKVPVLTIYNTLPEFYWVTNYLETIISNLLWKPMTSATIAHTYRKVLTKWQEKTDAERGWFIDWQGHDFSMRGMDSIEATISSGLGHLTSFSGTDSLPTLYGARKFYGEDGFVGGSVNATEHSVMCAGSKDDEVETFRRLLKTYPTGILSIVSDTWDLWKVCTRLESKGFASTNVVLGIGSFTYQYNTRDTFGFAMKATYVELEELFYETENSVEPELRIVGREIFKDPITDDGTKKSATGLLAVYDNYEGGLTLIDKASWETENEGKLKTIYKDGEFFNQTTLTEIRERLK